MSPDQTDPIDTDPIDSDPTAALDELEADLAAVETALGELDRITGDGAGGDEAARAIDVAVPPERFRVTGDAPPPGEPASPGSDLVGDGLLDQ